MTPLIKIITPTISQQTIPYRVDIKPSQKNGLLNVSNTRLPIKYAPNQNTITAIIDNINLNIFII